MARSVGSLEAGCLSISWLYSVAAQPFDAQQLLYARWVLYGATGCLFAAELASLVAVSNKAQLLFAHSIATSPRAESSGSDYAAAAYGSWGAERPPAAQPALIESRKGLSQVICAAPAYVMAANDEVTRLRAERTRLSAKRDRLRADNDELREQLSAKMERNHYLRVKFAHQAVQAACARVKAATDELREAQQNMYREEDALQDFLASRARNEDPLKHYKRARAEESSGESAAPEKKTKRKRASESG